MQFEIVVLKSKKISQGEGERTAQDFISFFTSSRHMHLYCCFFKDKQIPQRTSSWSYIYKHAYLSNLLFVYFCLKFSPSSIKSPFLVYFCSDSSVFIYQNVFKLSPPNLKLFWGEGGEMKYLFFINFYPYFLSSV